MLASGSSKRTMIDRMHPATLKRIINSATSICCFIAITIMLGHEGENRLGNAGELKVDFVAENSSPTALQRYFLDHELLWIHSSRP